MFDVAFSELVVIAVVALIVVGPERLPGLARTAGHLLGRARRYVNDVKADIENELHLDELKQLRSQFQESALSLEQEVRQSMESAHAELQESLREGQPSLSQIEEAFEGQSEPAEALTVHETPAQDGSGVEKTEKS